MANQLPGGHYSPPPSPRQEAESLLAFGYTTFPDPLTQFVLASLPESCQREGPSCEVVGLGGGSLGGPGFSEKRVRWYRSPLPELSIHELSRVLCCLYRAGHRHAWRRCQELSPAERQAILTLERFREKRALPWESKK